MLFPASRRIALSPKWTRDILWRRARAVPSLDLRFAENKSLVDATTGQNLVTFTRASSGTYVGSDGLIKTAATNLLLQSEDFATTWSTVNTSISTNAITSPTGQLTADKIIEDTNTGTHNVQQNVAVISGTFYTFSVYVKSAERSAIALRFSSASFGALVTASYNLTSQTATVVTSGTSTSASIIAVGDGWYRCSLTSQATASATTAKQILLENPAGTRSYTGDNTSGIYLWGAQLEQSTTVGEYIPTTSTINSAPRFDHNPTTGESLGLLVEEQRVNNHLYSEDLSNWGSPTNASVTANATTAPDGTLTADKLVEDSTNNQHFLSSTTLSFSYTSGTTYVRSCWLKAAGRNFATLYFPSTNFPSTGRVAVFNLSAGTVESAQAGVTASITAFPNGWYRCAISRAATATGSGHSGGTALYSDATTTTYTGDGASGVFIWGAQLEAGTFPTSYIPTTTATVTRSADVASITGSNFSSWYNTTQGTVFTSQKTAAIDSQQGAYWFSASPTVGRGIAATIDTRNVAQRLAVYNRDDVSVSSLNVSPLVDGAQQKIAHSWSGGTQSASLNGLLNTGSYNAIYPSINQLSIGFAEISAGSPQYLSGSIERLTFWPSRLPNNTLQGITQ